MYLSIYICFFCLIPVLTGTEFIQAQTSPRKYWCFWKCSSCLFFSTVQWL